MATFTALIGLQDKHIYTHSYLNWLCLIYKSISEVFIWGYISYNHLSSIIYLICYLFSKFYVTVPDFLKIF